MKNLLYLLLVLPLFFSCGGTSISEVESIDVDKISNTCEWLDAQIILFEAAIAIGEEIISLEKKQGREKASNLMGEDWQKEMHDLLDKYKIIQSKARELDGVRNKLKIRDSKLLKCPNIEKYDELKDRFIDIDMATSYL